MNNDLLMSAYQIVLPNINVSLSLFLFFSFSNFPSFPDSGRAISFKPDDDSTFLVGTDEGMVYLCTTQYSSRYLNTYPVMMMTMVMTMVMIMMVLR